MTAHAIANYLGMKILVANYAEIESKYVGEAPKNLLKVFELADKHNAILFFDEADTFLSKRISSINSSADHALNALKSQMLILLENFSGIVIFATNFVKSYDEAFNSRIFKHIRFELPDKETRKKIIKIMIPPKAPLDFQLDDENLEKLAEISEGFSGRDIKNAVKDVLITALYKNLDKIPLSLFEECFEKYKKLHKNLKNDINKEKVEESIRINLESGNFEVQKFK